MQKAIIDDVKKYMDAIGFKEDKAEEDGDYAIYKAGNGTREYIRLVFRQKGNRKHIDHFISKGWIKGKSYRNYTGSPSMWDAEMFISGCSTGMFMVTLEYSMSRNVDELLKPNRVIK